MSWKLRGAALGLGLVLGGTAPGLAATLTTTTTYTYNADGAPTAVTTQVDATPATTTYLIWDNFTPDAAAPSSGTVSPADGNLVDLGVLPGQGAQFAYDVRDRLTACSRAGRSAASYAYHPNSLMASSTLASGDALQFYYDDAATPRMINTLQPSTGVAASFLGPVRYLSDGSEQVLLGPRKDTAGVYDATTQSLASYSYDPYGASQSTDLGARAAGPHAVGESVRAGRPRSQDANYDLTENPFRYAGEYRDPTCDAYYLRARWYLPAQQTFLSRDPADPLHRYSYTAGNPVGRTDPSGLKYTGADFSRDVDKLVGKLTPGLWAYIEPVLPVWGQALGGIELVGLLPSFWHHPTTQGYVTFGFLATSIVAESLAESPQFDRLSPFLLHPNGAFGTRLGFDLALGGSQTAAQSDQHGRLDVPALVQGIDTTVSGMLADRFGAGIGYRPHNMTAADVDRMALGFLPGADDTDAFYQGKALVYLVRQQSRRDYTTPWMESRMIGHYHEYVLTITEHSAFVSELQGYIGAAIEQNGYAILNERRPIGDAPSAAALGGIGPGSKARFIGVFDAGTAGLSMYSANPLGFPTRDEVTQRIANTGRAPLTSYGRYSRNCHDHAYGVIHLLQNPRRYR